MCPIDTVFQNSSSGAAASSSDYLKDNFNDVSLAANSNTGFSSTVSRNPLNKYFANDDFPRYGIKTLYIKDLVLVEDRTLWINNKPTYDIVWHEPFAAAKGYVYGNVRLRNNSNGLCVEISNIDDGAGLVGVVRQMGWIYNPSTSTGTADMLVDGSDTSSDATFGSAASDNAANGVNEFNFQLHAGGKQTRDLHDFRITANEYRTLNVSGVVLYYENSTTDIDCFPGSSYIDKTKYTTTNGTNVALPSVTSRLGAKTVIYKTSSNSYAQSTVEVPYIATVGQGSTNTNLVTVTTGHGSSFPIGSGVISIQGTSYYIGQVTNQSTDTLTLFPTLSYGLSGLLYKAHLAGVTQAINASYYTLARTIDMQAVQRDVDANTFLNGNKYYQEPNGAYRLWGNLLTVTAIEGYRGFAFSSNGSSAFLQLDAQCSAAEIEIAGSGIFHATFSINGIPAFGVNEGFSGIIKRTVFTDSGYGLKSILIQPGSSMGGFVVRQFNLYNNNIPIGVTLGRLASFDTFMDHVPRSSDVVNASLMALGPWTRVFADRAYLTGAWTRGTTFNHSGGVFYSGASTNSTLKFQYYGTNFAIIGTAGSSVICTLDGASINSSFNALKSVSGGATFHSVVLTHQAGTSVVSAFDYQHASIGNFQSLQKESYEDAQPPIPKVYNQDTTPENPKDGDIWANASYGKVAWIYLFGKWNQISLPLSSDDPNAQILIRSHGGAGESYTTAQSTSHHFNFVAWSTGADSGAARCRVTNGESKYGTNHYKVGGIDTANTANTDVRSYNKTAWISQTAVTAAATNAASSEFGGYFFLGWHSNNVDYGGGQTTWRQYNGSAWSNAVDTTLPRSNCAGYVLTTKFYSVGGLNTTGYDATARSWNGTTLASETAGSVNSEVAGSMQAPNSAALILYGNGGGTASGYTYNGSSYTSVGSLGYQLDTTNAFTNGAVGGFAASSNESFFTGGATAASTAITTTTKWSGTSFASSVACNANRSGGAGSVF